MPKFRKFVGWINKRLHKPPVKVVKYILDDGYSGWIIYTKEHFLCFSFYTQYYATMGLRPQGIIDSARRYYYEKYPNTLKSEVIFYE